MWLKTDEVAADDLHHIFGNNDTIVTSFAHNADSLKQIKAISRYYLLWGVGSMKGEIVSDCTDCLYPLLCWWRGRGTQANTAVAVIGWRMMIIQGETRFCIDGAWCRGSDWANGNVVLEKAAIGEKAMKTPATAAKIAGMATRKRSSTDMMQQQGKRWQQQRHAESDSDGSWKETANVDCWKLLQQEIESQCICLFIFVSEY
jgi:hypothetical protein